MVKPVQYRRFMWLVVLLIIAFAGLGYRLVDLQVLQREEILPEAEKRTQATVIRSPRRGDILDCRQTLLAGSEIVKTICADPTYIGSHQVAVARVLAPLLKTNEAWLIQRLQPSFFTNEQGRVVPRRYVVLKNKVPIEEWERIRDTMQRLDLGVEARTKADRLLLRNIRSNAIYPAGANDQLRFYPNGSLAAHILGFVGTEERRTNQQTFIETKGRSGVELMFDEALTGIPGWRKTEMYRKRELATYRGEEIAPRNGHNVVLTIDAGVQHILEAELADAVQKYSPASACGIVVRPHTGEIVAMATLPTFDPNNPGASPPEAWRNRVITDTYEPGSTFKIVAVSGALNDGLVTLQSQFDCEHGHFWYANHRLKDDHPLGIATVEEIIVKSSNIGTAKIGLQMGRERLYQYIRGYGFWQPTGLGLQGEVRGLLTPPGKWSQLQSSRVPIGHGVAVTPLQMVMAMSALANGGRLMQPTVIDRLIDDEGHVVFRNQPKVVRQVVSEATARQMIAALKRVVSTDGTASRAILEHYTIAGKTGTAEMPGPRGYIYNQYVGSFMGFLPADQPELCIGVVLIGLKPPLYYGGHTAAPTFRAIAERAAKYLALKPDLLPSETQMASMGTNRHGSTQPQF
ncbi:MAG: penicillin-binding protein 2 [Verrucomicrobiales bacterium]|nr:penicillin-binding protein 2 [Verrucomicrobiales bacterium]